MSATLQLLLLHCWTARTLEIGQPAGATVVVTAGCWCWAAGFAVTLNSRHDQLKYPENSLVNYLKF